MFLNCLLNVWKCTWKKFENNSDFMGKTIEYFKNVTCPWMKTFITMNLTRYRIRYTYSYTFKLMHGSVKLFHVNTHYSTL
jgi:hypothetical protein